MNEEIIKKLKRIKIENLMYILFILASILDIYANEKAKKELIEGRSLNEKIRNQYVIASIMVLIVFYVFMQRNYNNLKACYQSKKEYELAKMRFFGSGLIVIGQVLIVNYLINTNYFNGSPI